MIQADSHDPAMDRLSSIVARITTDPALRARVDDLHGTHNAKRREYVSRRAKRDARFAWVIYLRSLLHSALAGKGRSARFAATFGYTVRELRDHVQPLFAPGMTWENYGKEWEIHHIIPCSSYKLTIRAHRRKCFARSNLQPVTQEQHKALNRAQHQPMEEALTCL